MDFRVILGSAWSPIRLCPTMRRADYKHHSDGDHSMCTDYSNDHYEHDDR